MNRISVTQADYYLEANDYEVLLMYQEEIICMIQRDSKPSLQLRRFAYMDDGILPPWQVNEHEVIREIKEPLVGRGL